MTVMDLNVVATLGELADEPVEQTGPSGDFVYIDISSIDRESKTIVGPKSLALSEAPSRAKQVLKAGDVLVSLTRPNLNAVALVPEHLDGAIGSTGFHVFRSRWLQPKFLFALVQSQHFVDAMSALVQGALYPAVRPRDVAAYPFVFATPRQQTRIVAKLEELLSDLDAGVAELKAAQKKLAQYRQSLLKAAVAGELTAAWRQHNHPTETGAQLLERILTERRARWETRQLAKFKEQGKTPPKDWQKKYPEPVQPDIAELPELPEGWVWASVDMLIDDGPQNGLYLPRELYGRGVPMLRIDDYQIGWHRARSDLNLVDASAEIVALYSLRAADLVINRVNSMSHLGKSLRIDEALDGVLFESNMMRLRLSSHVSVDYVSLYLGSDVGRQRLTQNAKWAVNQASINQQDTKRTPIPLPPQPEQIVITDTLQAQLEAATSQLKAIELSLQQATAQRQNILRAAFSGQLVPQDPADEPAGVLLERIRSERAAQRGTPTRRGRKKETA